MLHKAIKTTIILCIAMLVTPNNSYSISIKWNNVWKRAELDSCSVTSIIRTYGNQRIVVGTEKGLFVSNAPFSSWIKVPIYDIKNIKKITNIIESKDNKSLVFLCHTEQDSSILISASYVDTQPWYFCKRTIAALKLQQLNSSEYNTNRLFATDGKVLFQTNKTSTDTYKKFSIVRGSENIFGTNKPLCTGIVWSSVDKLFIIGYDSAQQTTGYFVYSLQKDSLIVFQPQPIVPADRICVATEMFRLNNLAGLGKVYISTSSGDFGFYDESGKWKMYNKAVLKNLKQLIAIDWPIPTFYTIGEFFFAITESQFTYNVSGYLDSVNWQEHTNGISGIYQCMTLVSNSIISANVFIGTSKGLFYNQGELIGLALTNNKNSSLEDNKFKIHYNNKKLTIVFNYKMAFNSISIKNVLGKTIYTISCSNSYTYSVDFSNTKIVLSPGIYYVTIDNKHTLSKQFLIF